MSGARGIIYSMSDAFMTARGTIFRSTSSIISSTKSFTERPVPILAPITTRVAILIAAFSGAIHHGMRRHQYSRSPS